MAKQSEFTHIDAHGNVSMVDVGKKSISAREAVATARVRMSAGTLARLEAKALPKGDVLSTAKIAGILGAKRTAELIPMTHPIPLTFIDVTFELFRDVAAIAITATVRCEARTGVEMEAMTACSIAALTVYDMCKSVEKGIVIESIRLEKKSGGKSGVYARE